MDGKARYELSSSIQREGVGLADDPQRIKALLLDACPELRTEISLLVAAAEDEIPSRLARSSESVFRDGEIARAVADLKRTRRLDHGAADWVVRSWAWALGVLDQEPTDDTGDPASAIPVQGSGSEEARSGPPQHSATAPHQANMSAPPYSAQSAPGYAAPSWPDAPTSPPLSAPPFGPNSGHPSQPWLSGGASGGQPGAPAAPPWPPPPGNQGLVSAGWGAPAAPARPGRGRLIAIVAAVAAVVLVVGLGAALMRQPAISPPVGQSANPTPVLDAATTDAPPSVVDFTITNSLGDFEVADTADVYSYGEWIGALQINSSSPYAELPVSGEPGPIDYQLEITMVLSPAYGGGSVTFSGSGTITAYAGARYSVQITQNTAGDYVATLQAESGS